jgi:hypothetical protein
MRAIGSISTNTRLDCTSLPPFLDMLSPDRTKKAQNGNQGTIQPYLFFGPVPATGLNGALSITFFQIADIWVQNPE